MSQERLNDDLAAIEAALCSLTPASSGIDRDRLMFLAGRASARRRFARHRLAAAFWPTAAAASLAAAVVFGTIWATGNNPTPAPQPGDVLMAGPAAPFDVPGDTAAPSPWENRRLCQLMLEKGIDAMPESSGRRALGVLPAPREDSYRSLLKQYLDNPTG
jgi:hypothetical protein